MADIVISPLLDLFFQKLVSPTFQKLVRYAGIHSQVKKWEASLSQIRDLLNDASRKEITDASIKTWLNRLQHLAYDIDDILDALATQAMHRELTEESKGIKSKVRKLIPTCCTSFSLSTRMHDKLNNITINLQELEKEKTTLGLTVINGRLINMNRSYETSLLPFASSIVGREHEKRELLNKLLGVETCNQNFNIVPIVGMGGIGKTTLARLLYNETQVQEHFKLKAWVCVSDEFNVFNISNTIFEAVTGEKKEFKDLNLLQLALKEKLTDKKFLLVLDDVWSESDVEWENLVRPFHAGAPGSKVIMTTRKEQLLKSLGYNHLQPLKSLSDDDALSLFSQHVGEWNLDSEAYRQYSKGIVKKCGGLPLALTTLGSLLRKNPDEEKWKEVLNSEIWSLPKEDRIVPALRLSYHDLDACLKILFAYCSLFPKDYLFDIEELILLWVAEGFLRHTTTRTKESLGRECFEELLSRSFFQHAPNEESLFVMHDLMNDLATFVAGDFFLRSDNDVRNEASEKYRHMSFLCEEYMGYKKFDAFKGAKNLRTFLAISVGVTKGWQSFYLSSKVLGELLLEFPLLRVLCLSYLGIAEVPESISSLKHLRYLNLSHTDITCLPESVCNLYNLETLIMCRCHRLTKLPKSFLKLKNLRHLDISNTRCLNEMPQGIGELKSLQTLSKIIIEGDNGFAITELKNLVDLRGRISIQGLEKVQHAPDANLLQKKLSELDVEWSDVFDGSRKETLEKEVLSVLKPDSDNLKRLGIVSYGGIEFPKWVGDPLFRALTSVSIYGCKKCTVLPPLGQLQSLKKLFIRGMDAMKDVGLELLGNGLAFPSLEILRFEDMKGWEVWSTNDGAFPCLEELRIKRCPNLVEVSLEALPSLRVIEIDGCGDGVLTSLVHVASSVTQLRMGSISGLSDEVWGGVVEDLGAVEELGISYCDEIRYLWESESKASTFLVNLSKLEVWWCDSLLSLGEKEDDCGSNLTSLRILEVFGCKSMERCNCPNSIESLSISDCSSMTFVSFPTGEKKLKSISMSGCEKLSEKAWLINSSMPMLESILIFGCSILKSITELNCFVHLTQLIIWNCESMESFPYDELPNLESLKRMDILNCGTSFCGGLWPPNLCELAIGKLKKPFSKWGPQKFPTSLVGLQLCGGSDVTSVNQMSHFLPSSLTKLWIYEDEKLESVSMGLQHLTSLQHLEIEECPKIEDLPEMLLPSLLSLHIRRCPKLEERCSRRGSYWRLISHIPCIKINYDLI